jgi:hypothetical protein
VSCDWGSSLLWFCLFFWERVMLSSPGWLELLILLLQPPYCWAYRHIPPHLDHFCDFTHQYINYDRHRAYDCHPTPLFESGFPL